jgi:hypothetical protein
MQCGAEMNYVCMIKAGGVTTAGTNQTSGGSRINTKRELNSENLGLTLEINRNLRLMNTYLMKKSGL